jgi:hypothetical protein
MQRHLNFCHISLRPLINRAGFNSRIIAPQVLAITHMVAKRFISINISVNANLAKVKQELRGDILIFNPHGQHPTM